MNSRWKLATSTLALWVKLTFRLIHSLSIRGVAKPLFLVYGYNMIELSSTSNSDFLKMQRRQKKGDAKWKDIEDLINRWARRNPQRAYELEQYIKEIREVQHDKKFATNSEALGRMGIAIDEELMQYIQAFYPDFMDTKDDMHEFMKRFKKFRVPEKT